MGQRLNIEIVEKRLENGEDEVVLANAYYHWSGYTSSANDLVSKIIDKIEEDDFTIIDDKRLYAIRLLEETGALVANEDHDAIGDIYPDEIFEKATSRNDGLIGYSDKAIKETRHWEEGRMTIYLSDRLVNAACHYEYEEEEEFRDSYGYEDREEYDEEIDGASVELSTAQLTFEEFRVFENLCEEADAGEYGAIKMPSGTIIAVIA